MKIFIWLFSACIAAILFAQPAVAQTTGQRGNLDSGEQAVTSTRLDFTAAGIDGQMRAPQGFMLQGRKGQSLSQMVRLRSNFKRELRGSRSAMKAVVK